MKTQLRTGIEIEGIINRDIHRNIRVGEYHNGVKLSKYWKTERDGSLNNVNNSFSLPLCVEFVSYKLKGKRGFFKAIDEFIKIISKNGRHELNEVINFNSSCGCHLHIGLENNKNIKKFIDFDILKEMRELFFNKIDSSNKIDSETKQKIKQHYFRSFAMELNKNTYNQISLSRNSEFNPSGERENKGFEWRSFNLLDVNNWEEFKEMFKIGFECLEFLFNKRRFGYSLKKEPLRIKKKELKDLFGIEENVDINLNKDLDSISIKLNEEDSICVI